MNRESFLLPKLLDRGAQINRLLDVIMKLPVERAFRVSVEEAKAARSDAQNDYYWAVPVKMISDYTGYEPLEVHEFLLGSHYGWKDKRAPKTPRNPTGFISVPRRTTTTDERGRRSKLNKVQFSEYLEFVARFAAEKCNLVVPPPDPNYYERRELAA